ncbi:MAG: Ig-like domain-containing protein, partial [Agathobacter sp.]|nr:Ig-like domain-containing protein [Agathobacter sp.]
SVIAEAGKNASATVTVVKDADGKVTDAQAKVTQTGTGSKTNVTTTISGDVVSQIAKAADTDSVAIKVTVTDSKGNTKYTVSADSKDVTAGNKLKVVAVDKKTGKYKLVNGKTYQVAEDGSVKVSLPKGADYALLSTKEAKTVEKAILKTVAPKKSTASVKKGKSTNLQMSSKLDMDNVKNITYSTSKKSVASISKNGKITAKKKGTVVVKAKVTLKNGTTKTVSMKIKVK